MDQIRKRYTCWVVLEKCEDVPGQWVAHALDFDVVTQGNDPVQALSMAREAASIVILDDLNAGKDPEERRADEEDWQCLYEIWEHGQRFSDTAEITDMASKNDDVLMAFQIPLEFVGQLEQGSANEIRVPLSLLAMASKEQHAAC